MRVVWGWCKARGTHHDTILSNKWRRVKGFCVKSGVSPRQTLTLAFHSETATRSRRFCTCASLTRVYPKVIKPSCCQCDTREHMHIRRTHPVHPHSHTTLTPRVFRSCFALLFICGPASRVKRGLARVKCVFLFMSVRYYKTSKMCARLVAP